MLPENIFDIWTRTRKTRTDIDQDVAPINPRREHYDHGLWGEKVIPNFYYGNPYAIREDPREIILNLLRESAENIKRDVMTGRYKPTEA